ncbi:MAG: methyltransferase family protein [Bacteroidota bacterium]
MKLTGSGPLIAIPTFTYFLLALIISASLKPLFMITESNYRLLVVIAVIMLAVDMVNLVACGIRLFKSNKQKTLITNGIYKVCRNPLYVSHVFLTIPALSLLLNSWLLFTTTIVGFVSILIFAPREYKSLEEEFGDEYRRYVKSVWIKFI